MTATDIRLDVRHYGTADELRDAVERGFVELGLVIHPGYDAALRTGGSGSLEFVAQPASVASAVRTALDTAIADQTALIQAARYSATARGIPFDQALATARERAPSVAGMAVAVEAIGDQTANPNGFAVGAQSQVILFMFLTSMTGAVALISTRTLGIARREFSTPTSAGTIVSGEALGRFAFALFQGAFIVVASAILFGVDWIDPLATAAIVVSFALVAAGAAMLVATVVSNEHQLSAIGPALGMLLALLGGAMVPIEVFPPLMRTVSHVTPHAWAIDAFHDLLLNGGGLRPDPAPGRRAPRLRGGPPRHGDLPLPPPDHERSGLRPGSRRSSPVREGRSHDGPDGPISAGSSAGPANR